jgi:hypothetical protein
VLNFKTLYKLGEAFARGAVRAKSAQDERLWTLDSDIALARGEHVPPASVRFEQYEGTRWLDYLGTQRAPLRFISERLLAAFEAEGLTGWKSHRVQLLRKDGRDSASDYRLFTVIGRCGPVDNAKSTCVDKIVFGNPRGAKVWKGMYFDESTWDGNDFFSPGQTALMFATQKVKSVLEREKATNIAIVSLADVERASLI